MRRTVEQIEMFQTGEDLPLFSGTPQRVGEPSGSSGPAQADHPDHLDGFDCALCYDTGVVTVDGQRRFCTCPHGCAARSRHHADAARQEVVRLHCQTMRGVV